MARGRLISKSLGISRKFHALHGEAGKLAEFAQVLFPLIVSNSDDYGRFDADAFTIKHGVLPTSPRPETDFEKALRYLHRVNLILRYEADGGTYLQVVDFEKHQTGLHKRSEKSKYPDPPKTLEPQGPREIPGTSGDEPEIPAQDKITELKGTEGKEDSLSAGADAPPTPQQRLASRLRDRILANKPDAKVPEKLDAWADTFRLMLERDKRPPARVATVIDYAQSDQFWKSNALSADAIRKHFDRLELRARGESQNGASSAAAVEMWEKIIGVLRKDGRFTKVEFKGRVKTALDAIGGYDELCRSQERDLPRLRGVFVRAYSSHGPVAENARQA